VELIIEGVSKTYANGTRALGGVSLTIGRGLFGLLGPNGAGKSTLMRSIATLQEIDDGSIVFRGHGADIDVSRDKERLREALGYLPQDFGLYPKVTAWDMLDHLAQLKGLADAAQRREQVKALLGRTNLWEHRDRRLGGFSGGMRQRFGIAQALLGDPKLLVVDEPTAGLDPAERTRFHNLLAELSEGIVVLLSTHIVGDVADLCQRMAVLAGGRVVALGQPTELVDGLRGRVWKRLVAGDKADELAELRKSLAVIAERHVAGQKLIHVVADGQPDGFEAVDPDLEDVYFDALRRAGA
jgi:ABC-type multidrug transport system ATPase subunit